MDGWVGGWVWKIQKSAYVICENAYFSLFVATLVQNWHFGIKSTVKSHITIMITGMSLIKTNTVLCRKVTLPGFHAQVEIVGHVQDSLDRHSYHCNAKLWHLHPKIRLPKYLGSLKWLLMLNWWESIRKYYSKIPTRYKCTTFIQVLQAPICKFYRLLFAMTFFQKKNTNIHP